MSVSSGIEGSLPGEAGGGGRRIGASERGASGFGARFTGAGTGAARCFSGGGVGTLVEITIAAAGSRGGVGRGDAVTLASGGGRGAGVSSENTGVGRRSSAIVRAGAAVGVIRAASIGGGGGGAGAVVGATVGAVRAVGALGVVTGAGVTPAVGTRDVGAGGADFSSGDFGKDVGAGVIFGVSSGSGDGFRGEGALVGVAVS